MNISIHLDISFHAHQIIYTVKSKRGTYGIDLPQQSHNKILQWSCQTKNTTLSIYPSQSSNPKKEKWYIRKNMNCSTRIFFFLPTTKRTICRKISFMFCVTHFKQRTPSTRAEVLEEKSNTKVKLRVMRIMVICEAVTRSL